MSEYRSTGVPDKLGEPWHSAIQGHMTPNLSACIYSNIRLPSGVLSRLSFNYILLPIDVF